MKKILTLFCFLILLSGSSFAADDRVMGVELGSSMKLVKAKYTEIGVKPSFEDKDSLGYKKTLIPFPDAEKVLYEFYNDKLWAVKVSLSPSAVQSMSFATEGSAGGLLEKYAFYKGSITQQYNVQPMIDEFMAEDFDNDGLRLSGIKNGKGHYKSEWETNSLRVLLNLSGENGQIDFDIYYIYKPIFREKEQAEAEWKMKWY